MIRASTPEETEARRSKVAKLRASDDPVDQIQALLMDTNVGGVGMHDRNARCKALAIVARLNGTPHPVTWTTIDKPGHILSSHPDDHRAMLSWTWSNHWWVYECTKHGYPIYDESGMWKKVTDQPFTRLEDAQAWVEKHIPLRTE